MSGFIAANSDTLVTLSLCLAVVSLLAVLLILAELRKMKRPFRPLAELHGRKGTEQALQELLKGVDENRNFIQSNADEIKLILGNLRACYCSAGLVKYNAFEDVGGMQSYSFCLLTKERNGFILTNLVGRNSSRGYALEIKGGEPSRELSDEEKKALESCLSSLES